MNRSPTREGQVLRISDAFVLAALSGFSYLAAYAFERGFAKHFGIPPELIDPRWTTIFSAGSAILLGAAVIAAGFWLLPAASRISPMLGRVFTAVTAFTVTGLVLLVIFGLSRWKLVLSSVVPVVILVMLFDILPTFVRRSLRSNARSAKKPEEESDHSLLVDGIRVPFWALVGGVWLLWSVALAFLSGRATAMNMQDFLVTSGSAPQAVIRIYGDKIVTADLDRQTRTLHLIYHILPLTDTGRVFTVERLRNAVPPCAPVSMARDSLTGRSRQISTFLQSYLDPGLADRHERCTRYRQRMDSTAKVLGTKRTDRAEGNTPTRVIGLKLGRTPASVYTKASEEGISLSPTNQRPYGTKK